MRKLVAVEEAKLMFTEAQDWSVFRWLTEKKRVRRTADAATAALNEAETAVKEAWTDALRKAYKANGQARGLDPELKLAIQRVIEADAEAEGARLDAEDTFAAAERHLSATLAREGARKAIESYRLHELAIRRAEALRPRGKG